MWVPEADCLHILRTNSLACANVRLLICNISNERQDLVMFHSSVWLKFSRLTSAYFRLVQRHTPTLGNQHE